MNNLSNHLKKLEKNPSKINPKKVEVVIYQVYFNKAVGGGSRSKKIIKTKAEIIEIGHRDTESWLLEKIN